MKERRKEGSEGWKEVTEGSDGKKEGRREERKKMNEGEKEGRK